MASDKDALAASIANRIAVRAGADAPWWWLSFADPTRPAGSQFLGVAIVRGLDVGSAVMEAHSLGINPGGEVMGQEWANVAEPPRRFRNTLLSREDIAAMDAALEEL
jgi:hypothetical protein